ncbi:hypothetical protein H2200_000204 [Cladophialophora chaetospira]|uniref:Uncharacterized protein n=1 Tax=Cladophialophora chaetospira TaxID=386627 RepID=A0AA38XMZ4_9EURO|nr:hypothetical protein H2200_000204 [Cladophialophora chaetospira]
MSANTSRSDVDRYDSPLFVSEDESIVKIALKRRLKTNNDDQQTKRQRGENVGSRSPSQERDPITKQAERNAELPSLHLTFVNKALRIGVHNAEDDADVVEYKRLATGFLGLFSRNAQAEKPSEQGSPNGNSPQNVGSGELETGNENGQADDELDWIKVTSEADLELENDGKDEDIEEDPPQAPASSKAAKKISPRTIGVSGKRNRVRESAESEDEEETDDYRAARIQEAYPGIEPTELQSLVETFAFVNEHFKMRLIHISACLHSRQDGNYKHQAKVLGTLIQLVDEVAVDTIVKTLVELRKLYAAKAAAAKDEKLVSGPHDIRGSLDEIIATLSSEDVDGPTTNLRKLYARTKLNEYVERRKDEIGRSKKKVDMIWDEIIQHYSELNASTRGLGSSASKNKSRQTWLGRGNVGGRISRITKTFGNGAILLLPKTITPTRILKWASGAENLLVQMLQAREKNEKGSFGKCSRACEDTMNLILAGAPAQNIVLALDRLLLHLFAAMRLYNEGVTWNDIKQEFPLSLIQWPEDITLTSLELKPELSDFSCLFSDGPMSLQAVHMAIQMNMERNNRAGSRRA